MPSTLPSLGIGHIALRCRDVDGMERFYREVLGFELVWTPAPTDRYLSRGRDNLALHATRDALRDDSHLDHFGLLVAEAEHVDQWAQHLAFHGVKLDAGPKTHRDQSRSLYFRDPEGNRIQIIWLGPGMTRS